MDIFTNHPHWPNVLEVCKTLTSNGYKAWLAGGCVRDLLLKTPPKDFDIATNALPDQVQALFPNSLDIGKQFGIIMVPFESFQIEIATFRQDGEYKNGRHPLTVTFSTPEEDAKRRDFTVNAMFFDPLDNKVHDFTEGQKDLKSKILRAVGNPLKRFEEDKLRMLRAVRFSAQLGFEIESDTLTAIQKFAPEIGKVSQERIQQELFKLFESKDLIKGLEYFEESKLHKEVFKSLTKNIELDQVFKKSMTLLKGHTSLDLVEKLYLFFYPFYKAPVGLEVIDDWLSQSKFPKDVIKRLLNLFEKAKWIKTIEKRSLGERILMSHSMHAEAFRKVYRVLIANTEGDSEKLKVFDEAFNHYKVLPKPLVNGHDLMTLGHPPGCEMGERLNKIYLHQLEKGISNKEALINWCKTAF